VNAAHPAALALPAAPTNVLIVGVGGQGVILVSKVLARLAQRHGLQVKQSEVHGMAKRGGSVFSHVRFGTEVLAPVIPAGEADVLVALEWAEGLRWLPHLRPGGSFIVDVKKIVPPFACMDRRHGAVPAYPRHSIEEILGEVPDSFALDATGIATEFGNEKAANTVLLGVLSTALDFPEGEWLETIAEFVPPKTRALNERSFHAGRNWATEARSTNERVNAPEEALRHAPVITGGRLRVSWEFEPAWCKGCDICVKFCPERCLVLNERQLAEMAHPEACTGCRMCEWLCPDFAITVRVTPEKDEAPAR
jgi:indolepyruvate ferredoxin oxidoreductase beta subunit